MNLQDPTHESEAREDIEQDEAIAEVLAEEEKKLREEIESEEIDK